MKGRQIKYSGAEMAWLEANRLMVISDYHRGFCETFRRADVALVNLHSLRKRKGWRTGRTGCFEKGQEPANKGKPMPFHPNSAATRFKKGGLPHNTRQAGAERLSKDGYVEISVNEINPYTGYERRFVLKHRWAWEQANGPVPKGMALKCLGERTNCDPANWVAVPRAILPRLNGGRRRQHIAYDEAPDDLKPAILTVARLAHAVREKTRA